MASATLKVRLSDGRIGIGPGGTTRDSVELFVVRDPYQAERLRRIVYDLTESDHAPGGARRRIPHWPAALAERDRALANWIGALEIVMNARLKRDCWDRIPPPPEARAA